MRALSILPPGSDPERARGAEAAVLESPEAWTRAEVAALRATAGVDILVRVAPGAPDLDAALSDAASLEAAMALRPDGLVLPGIAGGVSLARLGARLAVLEAETGATDGAMEIVALIDTARGVLALDGLPGASRRLSGIAWDASGLARDLGLDAPVLPDGRWHPVLVQVRARLVVAAAAAGVPAIESAGPGGWSLRARIAAGDGFGAMLRRDDDRMSATPAVVG